MRRPGKYRLRDPVHDRGRPDPFRHRLEGPGPHPDQHRENVRPVGRLRVPSDHRRREVEAGPVRRRFQSGDGLHLRIGHRRRSLQQDQAGEGQQDHRETGRLHLPGFKEHETVGRPSKL